MKQYIVPTYWPKKCERCVNISEELFVYRGNGVWACARCGRVV